SRRYAPLVPLLFPRSPGSILVLHSFPTRRSSDLSARIIFKHILPNTIGTIVVSTTLLMGGGILTEAALSFLGFGIQLPNVSLGRSEEHTSELQSRENLVCRLLLEKKKTYDKNSST